MQEVNETNKNIYINGQPFEGIGEVKEAVPGEIPEYIRPVPPNTVELTVKITPEQAAKIVAEFTEAVRKAAEEMNRILREWCEDIRRVWMRAVYKLNKYIEAEMYYANDNPRWWHLYKHAKKYRTRKKYRRLLMEQMLRKRAAAR